MCSEQCLFVTDVSRKLIGHIFKCVLALNSNILPKFRENLSVNLKVSFGLEGYFITEVSGEHIGHI